MKLNREREGEIFVFVGSVLWGFFPIITLLSYHKLSPLLSLATSTFLAAIFFALILSFKNKWSELKNISALKNILGVAIFNGVLYYLFYFFALRFASAGNVSIIAQTEIFFSYLFFHVFKKDPFPREHLFGSILMVLGTLIIFYPSLKQFQGGELLMLIGAAVAPFGNFFAQRSRKLVSSDSVLFIRSIIAAIILFFVSSFLRINFTYLDLKDSLFFLILNGFLMLGFSKIMWLEGIHRLTVTKGNALGCLSPLLTLLFAWIILKEGPTFWQIFSIIPMFFGVILLSKQKKN